MKIVLISLLTVKLRYIGSIQNLSDIIDKRTGDKVSRENPWLNGKNGKLGCNTCVQAKNSIHFKNLTQIAKFEFYLMGRL